MARNIKEEDSDDEIILSSRVKKETSTPKGETLPPSGSCFFFFPSFVGIQNYIVSALSPSSSAVP